VSGYTISYCISISYSQKKQSSAVNGDNSGGFKLMCMTRLTTDQELRRQLAVDKRARLSEVQAEWLAAEGEIRPGCTCCLNLPPRRDLWRTELPSPTGTATHYINITLCMDRCLWKFWVDNVAISYVCSYNHQQTSWILMVSLLWNYLSLYKLVFKSAVKLLLRISPPMSINVKVNI